MALGLRPDPAHCSGWRWRYLQRPGCRSAAPCRTQPGPRCPKATRAALVGGGVASRVCATPGRCEPCPCPLPALAQRHPRCSPATAEKLSPGFRQCAAVTTHFSLMMDAPQKPTPWLFTRWTCGSGRKSCPWVCINRWGRRVGCEGFVWLQDRLCLGCADPERLLRGDPLPLRPLLCRRGGQHCPRTCRCPVALLLPLLLGWAVINLSVKLGASKSQALPQAPPISVLPVTSLTRDKILTTHFIWASNCLGTSGA